MIQSSGTPRLWSTRQTACPRKPAPPVTTIRFPDSSVTVSFSSRNPDGSSVWDRAVMAGGEEHLFFAGEFEIGIDHAGHQIVE